MCYKHCDFKVSKKKFKKKITLEYHLILNNPYNSNPDYFSVFQGVACRGYKQLQIQEKTMPAC